MSQGGLSGGETAATLQTFAKQTGITFPILLGGATQIHYSLGASTAPFPIEVIIGKKGKIAYVAGRYNAAAMEQVVIRELKK